MANDKPLVFDVSLIWLVTVLYFLTVAISWPGHYSLDSVIQLAEGMTGTYISFNPPLMGQLLGFISKYLGHGYFMALNALLFFAAAFLILVRDWTNWRRFWPPAISIVFIALNPITLIYNGTVWKDVFCANLLLLAFAIVSFECKTKKIALVLALFLGSTASLVRPQGIIVTVVLCSYAAFMFVRPDQKLFIRCTKVFASCLVIVGVFVSILSLGTKMLQNETKVNASEGIIFAARFDIAGTVYFSKKPEAVLSIYVPDAEKVVSVARSYYTPERVDTSAPFIDLISHLNSAQTLALLKNLIYADPVAFLHHKFKAAQALFGNRLEGQCLPAHVGISSEALDVLKQLDFPYSFASGFLPSPSKYVQELWNYRQENLAFFSGWIWLLILLVIFPVALLTKNYFAMAISAGGALYAISFILIGMACDFRYQYFAVVAAMFGSLSIMCQWAKNRF
jgi:hypothetical protein